MQKKIVKSAATFGDVILNFFFQKYVPHLERALHEDVIEDEIDLEGKWYWKFSVKSMYI